MQHNFQTLHGWVLIGATCAMAMALAVDAGLAILGKTDFAWHQLPVFALLYCLTKAQLTTAQAAAVKRAVSLVKAKAAMLASSAYLVTSRAVRRLSALFTSPELRRAERW